MNFSFRFGLTAAAAAGIIISSCVNVDKSLGESFIPDNQLYDLYTAEFPIEDIRQEMADSLSAYSLYKFTLGAVRDETFGLTTRAAAFTIVPVNDTLDYGNPGTQVFRQFHFSAVGDSTSYDDFSQEFILQNINVYELDKPMDMSKLNPGISYTKKRITDGIPVYNGRDSLSFNFSKEFGEKYMTITSADLDTISEYTKRFPGIILSTDVPAGNGGRINMFRLPISVSSGMIYGSMAELKFTADYGDRKQVDTSFIFYFGPAQIYDMGGVTATSPSTYPQFAFDMTTHESEGMCGQAGDKIYMEGGLGIKPVIKAAGLREKMMAEILQHTDDPSSVVVSKATIEMPFEFPDDYLKICQYPIMISPTCRIVTDTTVTFAGITDASAADENQGDINRSLCNYAPDISHHAQEIIYLEDLGKIENYDIWMLAMANETIFSGSSSSSSSSSDYLDYLTYANYYNSMYNGYGYGGYGYGGYGGYGYDSYYNNYYNLMMMQSLYSSSSSSNSNETTTATMMDYHRFYRSIFNGPSAEGRKPMFKITYAIPKAKY
ncbi:MAG: hypothetical protein ACI3ZO_06940 [Candidatus Cryptobacteroides sp.]|nr:hypothetical protein [Bacteroidales bacterium]